MFKAIYLTQNEEKKVSAKVTELDEGDLPELPVEIDVEFSTINYKDGLAILGKPGVVRTYPMIPGIDLAGTVVSSKSPNYSPGDKVVLNGWEVGESHWGGLAQKARLDDKVPARLDKHAGQAVSLLGLVCNFVVFLLTYAVHDRLQ